MPVEQKKKKLEHSNSWITYLKKCFWMNNKFTFGKIKYNSCDEINYCNCKAKYSIMNLTSGSSGKKKILLILRNPVCARCVYLIKKFKKMNTYNYIITPIYLKIYIPSHFNGHSSNWKLITIINIYSWIS